MDAVRPWRTVNVVPLSATWSNRFRTNDGRAINDPCPALLVQERGGETRVVFASYANGEVFPACQMAGYEDSSSTSRVNPHRADEPPWMRLDERDPVQTATDKAANAMREAFVLPPPRNITN
jgi:hypothetical protein